MFKYLLIIWIFFQSFSIFANDLSGFYEGVRCKGIPTCVESDLWQNALGNILLFERDTLPLPKGASKRTLIKVHHDTELNFISIFFPDFNYFFRDMLLNVDQFEGTDDRSGNHSIAGSFLDDTVTLTLKRFSGHSNETAFHYKTKLYKIVNNSDEINQDNMIAQIEYLNTKIKSLESITDKAIIEMYKIREKNLDQNNKNDSENIKLIIEEIQRKIFLLENK